MATPGFKMEEQFPMPYSVLKQGYGNAQGTFGELLQGKLPGDDGQFLVNLPIQQHAVAKFKPDIHTRSLTVSPSGKNKVQILGQKFLRDRRIGFGGHLTIHSDLPEGKGLASSSADLVAAARALADGINYNLPTESLMSYLRDIEPTDGVMYREFVTFFHRKVTLGRRLGFPSRLRILAIDEGGQVDTVEFNRRNHSFSVNECEEYAELLKSIEGAILSNNLRLIGEVATRSAILNQPRNPKWFLDTLLNIKEKTNALGVVVAHSGSYIGLLYPHADNNSDEIKSAIAMLEKLRRKVYSFESLVPCPNWWLKPNK